MKLLDRLAYLVAGTAITAGVIAFGPVGGGLEPPEGPVEDTTPSLAEVQASVAGGGAQSGGPWEVFNAPLLGGASSVAGPLLVAEGRVQLHSITAHRAHVTAFDGPGQIDTGNFFALSGEVIGRLTTYFGTGGNLSTETAELDVIVENGLYLGFWVQTNTSHVTVLYRRLN